MSREQFLEAVDRLQVASCRNGASEFVIEELDAAVSAARTALLAAWDAMEQKCDKAIRLSGRLLSASNALPSPGPAQGSESDGKQWPLTRAISALENWGHHHSWCAHLPLPGFIGHWEVPPSCNCGYSAELSALRAALSAPLAGPDDGRKSEDQKSETVEGACSRCHKAIADFTPPNGGMTAGYYVAAAWEKYANPGEVYICDACMWAGPRYIEDYGHQPAGWVKARPAAPPDDDRERWAKYCEAMASSDEVPGRDSLRLIARLLRVPTDGVEETVAAYMRPFTQVLLSDIDFPEGTRVRVTALPAPVHPEEGR